MSREKMKAELASAGMASRRDFLRTTATGIPVMLAGGMTLANQGGSVAQSHVQSRAGLRDLQDSGGQFSASGHQYAVATVHRLASQAAMDVMQAGGNAIDGAVAASFMLSVVDGHNSGIGGGCFALIRTADGRLHAIDGREEAPAAATADMYIRDGKADGRLSQTGPLAVGVPGQVAALEMLSQRLGMLAWEKLVEPAVNVAQEGFVLGRLANIIRKNAGQLSMFSESKRILMPGDRLLSGTDTLRQPDLARTLNGIAKNGSDYFYNGPVAKLISDHLLQTGGILTTKDLAAYRAKVRQPIVTGYRGLGVVGFPPPSSGGIHLAQMLGMLSGFDVKAIFAESNSQGLHLLLEVMKRAMADRAFWLGDADYAKVPKGLLDPEYLDQLASSIVLDRSAKVEQHGMPPGAESQFFGDKHTTHLTTADAQGNVVALTQTVNTSFGSKFIAKGTGVVLNNQMDDFSIAPGVKNAFGLVGGQANAIAPGKRPLSSMSPTIVLSKTGQPVLTCGAAGGPKIITSTLQNVIRVLDLGQSIEQAIGSPRVHHQWSPDEAVCEKTVKQEDVAQLKSLGHQVSMINTAAVAQGIEFQWVGGSGNGDGGDKLNAKWTLNAVADRRAGGCALAE